jgi:hypothetical protein
MVENREFYLSKTNYVIAGDMGPPLEKATKLNITIRK